ncbi:MAG: nicotinate (nicotinamide) nucleotide adenylyltransferase, partial [Oscillospiraceae bacterium]|nr:nicotinate (nicotinamide) nucleotide adenylyltransferase [Oscillospiraceae bacterium]
PAIVSPFKQNDARKPADGRQRYEMCRLAFEDMSYVRVSDYEVSLPEVSYTVNTLRHLRELYPNDELFFIMGSDMLLSFEKWYRYEEILSFCTVIAASRESGQSDIAALEKQAEKLGKYGRIIVVPTSVYVMSSTEIYEKIKNNIDISCYVPKNVVKYISEHGLYA